MASGPLRFRTPYITELPTTQQRQAPGFAWVAVSGPPADPSKDWGTTNRKRARNSTAGGQTDAQKEALSARQQRDIERKIKELNADGANRDVAIPGVKGGAARPGNTPSTKKILASGKTFAHYVDDEEAEIARTGKRDGDLEVGSAGAGVSGGERVVKEQRASKTPIARRKPPPQIPLEGSAGGSQASGSGGGSSAPPLLMAMSIPQLSEEMDVDTKDDLDGYDPIPPLPSQAELEALINAPPLTYNQARSAPPPASDPPRRKFCEICGYFGRIKCMKCGNMTCSVRCKDSHDVDKCLKFYA